MAGALVGAGCQDLLPSIYVSSTFGWISFLLIAIGVLLLFLVRGFDRNWIRAREVVRVLAAFLGQAMGMVGGMEIRQEILKRKCARDGQSMACFGVFEKTAKVGRPPPAKPKQLASWT
jgi:hypothetical protein